MITPPKPGPSRHWPPIELAYLKASYGTENIKSLARRLGRTPRGVYAKANRLGLKRGYKEREDPLIPPALRDDYRVLMVNGYTRAEALVALKIGTERSTGGKP